MVAPETGSFAGKDLTMFVLSIAAVSASLTLAAPTTIDPDIVETRIVDLTQTVTLNDIPAGTKQVRLWVPIPSDRSWQRVLSREVVSAPGTGAVERQSEGRGEFVYVTIDRPTETTATVVVKCTVEREGVHFPLENASLGGTIQPVMFEESLEVNAPLMEANAKIKAIADQVCGSETDVAKQAQLLMAAVADKADHYSKDPSKPKCGRGSAEDCLVQGGGCCTDLHSLFIALARARGIPARLQYGYRMLDAKAGAEYDPGYRCWIEFFVPGTGWVPTDIVAADGVDAAHPQKWDSLSATRVWLWEGRSFELTPVNKSGPVDTMICGWAEIDGKPVDVLPAKDGSPSKLGRKVKFEVVKTDRKPDDPKLPE